MDITKQRQEQQEAKRQQGNISSFIGNFQVGTLLTKQPPTEVGEFKSRTES